MARSTAVKTETTTQNVDALKTAEIKAPVKVDKPQMQVATFRIRGTAPLVVHRFSHKKKMEMLTKMEKGSAGEAKKKKVHAALDKEREFNDARYISPDGWDGFNVAAIRNALIDVCRVCDIKMTLAKMSVFVEPDGRDAKEPQYGLVRILNSKPRLQEDVARVETGQPYVTIRPAYDDWEADLKIKFDTRQFSLDDIGNLLTRVGLQVGLCEGRPFSKNSAGMGWGTFELVLG